LGLLVYRLELGNGNQCGKRTGTKNTQPLGFCCYLLCVSAFIYTAMLLIAEKLGAQVLLFFTFCYSLFSISIFFFVFTQCFFLPFAGLVCFEHAPLKTDTRNKFLVDGLRKRKNRV